MIVELRRHTPAADVAAVRDAVIEAGSIPHEVVLRGRRSFVVVPDPAGSVADRLATLSGVDRIVPATSAYELAARGVRPHGTVICAGGVPIGDGGSPWLPDRAPSRPRSCSPSAPTWSGQPARRCCAAGP